LQSAPTRTVHVVREYSDVQPGGKRDVVDVTAIHASPTRGLTDNSSKLVRRDFLEPLDGCPCPIEDHNPLRTALTGFLLLV
jgi:hypothetical protein